ncbi:MAG: bifunctional DNA-formamidopyrimidine glycosylase/DNA-(apurinic or apyrimidinic site) lyase [Candidatus Acidiferrales bacterium]|jgi:formamidopyrimidine-DNA glycosylase
MPELPEVEAVVVALRSLVRGTTICRCRVIHTIAVRPSSGRGGSAAAKRLAARLAGQTIQDVERLGKYLLLRLERGFVVMHFRLDGQLVWFPDGTIAGHIDVAIETNRGTLGFVDPRHFGRVLWLEQIADSRGVAELGVDPLSKEFTPTRLLELLSSSKRPLKEFLLAQNKIAGIGNIYSSESLWLARLNPRKRAYRVNAVEGRRLHKAIVEILGRALECCLNPPPDFRNPDWWFQGLDAILQVYGREGLACRRCKEKIRRIEQGGRSTYACLRCQK